VILVVVFALGLLSVPLAGGRLSALGGLRLRRHKVLIVAFVLQLIALKAPIPQGPAAALNLCTYFLGCWYLLANLDLPGMWLIGFGTASNMLALLANGGVMPASEKALTAAGLSAGSSGFVNSTAVPNAQVAFLGDVFAIPRSLPLHNVFSIGDVLILLGGLVAVHRICGSRLFPSGNSQFRALRRNHDFMSLWTAQAVSNVGDWVYTMAVFASLGGRASPHIFATLMLAEVGPSALTGALGGPLVDRLPRRALMVVADLGRAAAVGSLFLVHTPGLVHLYLVAVLLGIMRALAQPALQASLPNVVHPDQLVAANSLVSGTYHSAVMIGPVIGGLLVAHVGVEPAFAINALSFAGSALLIARVTLPPQPPTEGWRPIQELREGLRYSLSTPLVRGLMIVIGMVMMGAAIKNPTEPAFVFQRLHGTTSTLGLVTGVWGVGMVLGTLIAPSAVRAWRREQLLTVGILVVGACLLATSRAVSVAPILMLYLFAGAGNGLGSVCYETLLQERTPDHLRGRVLAACDAVFDGALLAGYAMTGLLDHRFGPRAMFAIAGIVFIGAALFSRMLIDRSPAGVAGDDAADADADDRSVAVLRVHHTEQLLAVGEAAGVLGDAGGQEWGGHGLGTGAVGRDDAVPRPPERVVVGERFGVGDVEGGAPDPTLVQRPHEIVRDDMRPSSHVDQPGVVAHGPQLGLGNDPDGFGREGEGQDDGVGSGEDLAKLVATDDTLGAGGVVDVEPCPTCAWLGLTTDQCCLDAERRQQPQQRFGNPARTQDRDLGAEEAPTTPLAPRSGARPLVEVP
jgi:MFS family permease